MWTDHFRNPADTEALGDSHVFASKRILVDGQRREAQIVHLLDLTYLSASTGEMTSVGVLVSTPDAELIFDLDGQQIPPNPALFEGVVAFQAIERNKLDQATLRIFHEKWQPGWLRGGAWASLDLRQAHDRPKRSAIWM